MIKFLRENMEYLGKGVWKEDALDMTTDKRVCVRYIRHIFKEPPWMELEVLDVSEASD